MTKLLSFLLLLTITAKATSGNCSNIFQNQNSIMKLSFDISGGIFYVEGIGYNSGYYQFSGLDFSTFTISVHFEIGSKTGNVTMSLPPHIFGFINGNSYFVNGNQITYPSSTELWAVGNVLVNKIGSFSLNITCHDGRTCFGIKESSGSPNHDMCPFKNYIATGSTCQAYTSGCYPCDCSCSHCYGPGPALCCDKACSSCFGPNNTACTSCNSGYYLQSSIYTCPKCDASCVTCYNSGNTSCYSCNPGYFSSSVNTCTKCDPACATCTGASNTACITCNSGYFLQPLSNSATCFTTCPFGYTMDNSTRICSCDSGSQPQSSSAVGCMISTVSKSLTSTNFVLKSSNTVSGMTFLNLALSVSAIESIANMQYLNLNHSRIALATYSILSSSPAPNWIVHYNNLDADTLTLEYGIFEKNQVSSLYFDNYGDSLTELMVYAGLCVIGLTAASFTSQEKLAYSIIGKTYAGLIGLFLSNVLGHIQSQILFSFIQLIKINLFVDAYSRASYIIAYLVMTSAIALQIFCFFKVQYLFIIRHKSRTQFRQNLSRIWIWRKYEMIFDCFSSKSKHAFMFNFWMTAFSTVYILLILTLQSLPVVQCLSIVLLVLVFILFSVTIKPIKEKVPNFLFFFNFLSILILAIINLAIAICEALNSSILDNDRVGWVIFYGIIGNSSVNVVIGLGGSIYELIIAIKKCIYKNKHKNSNQITQMMKNISDLTKADTPLRPLSRQEIVNMDSENNTNRSKSFNLNELAADKSTGLPSNHHPKVVQRKRREEHPTITLQKSSTE